MASSKSTSSPTQTVEHFVLFKVKPDTDPSKVNAMVNNLHGLISLDTVLHLAVGPVVRNRSSALTFTHMLHSRYASKPDLEAYAKHPEHVGVVTENVRPICEDIMAVDWVSSEVREPKIPPGSAYRVTLLKLKEECGEKEKEEILGVIGGIKEKFPVIDQLSYGENFSPARAKGYSIGSLAVFKGLNELEALDLETEKSKEEKEKVKDKLDEVVVLDFVIPPPHSASL